MRTSPSDLSAAGAAAAEFVAVGELAIPPENGEALASAVVQAFRQYRTRLIDSQRPITLSTLSMNSSPVEFAKGEGFLFTLYTFANALSLLPRQDVQANEITPLLQGYRKLHLRAASVDPTLKREAEAFAADINLTASAEMMDENVVVAQEVRPMIDQFVKALGTHDQAAISEFSSDTELLTVEQWRKRFMLDPKASGPLEWKYSVAGRGWRDMWVVIRPVGAKEWNIDGAVDLYFRKMRGHWTVTHYPDGDREAAATRPWLLPPDERKGDPTTRYAPKPETP